MRLTVLLEQVRACKVCEPSLPAGARPLVQISASARVLIIGQAPGRVAHESGIPWNDKSGDRLRDWLGVDRKTFYNERRFALMPTGFCYPGSGKSGDLPPRTECAPLWRSQLLAAMKGIRLTIYVGGHAFASHLADQFETLTDAARAADQLLPRRMALPHPSPRNNLWLKRNPWFDERALPALRAAVAAALAGAPAPAGPERRL